jgi:hypothetical protein
MHPTGRLAVTACKQDRLLSFAQLQACSACANLHGDRREEKVEQHRHVRANKETVAAELGWSVGNWDGQQRRLGDPNYTPNRSSTIVVVRSDLIGGRLRYL